MKIRALFVAGAAALAFASGCVLESESPDVAVDEAFDIGAPPSDPRAPELPLVLCPAVECAGQPVSQIACSDGTPPERACVSVAGAPCLLMNLGCEPPTSCGGIIGDVCPVGEQCVLDPEQPNHPGVCIETPAVPAPTFPCGHDLRCDEADEVCEIVPPTGANQSFGLACVDRAAGTSGCDLSGANVCGDDGVAACREWKNGGTYAVCQLP